MAGRGSHGRSHYSRMLEIVRVETVEVPSCESDKGQAQTRFNSLMQSGVQDFDSLWRLRVRTFSTTRSTSVRKKPFAGWRTATLVPCPSAEAISFQR